MGGGAGGVGSGQLRPYPPNTAKLVSNDLLVAPGSSHGHARLLTPRSIDAAALCMLFHRGGKRGCHLNGKVAARLVARCRDLRLGYLALMLTSTTGGQMALVA